MAVHQSGKKEKHYKLGLRGVILAREVSNMIKKEEMY